MCCASFRPEWESNCAAAPREELDPAEPPPPPAGEALTPVVLQTHRVLMYPECPRYDPSRHFTVRLLLIDVPGALPPACLTALRPNSRPPAPQVAGDDLGFAVEQMLESPSLSKPFSRFTYFCQVRGRRRGTAFSSPQGRGVALPPSGPQRVGEPLCSPASDPRAPALASSNAPHPHPNPHPTPPVTAPAARPLHGAALAHPPGRAL